MTANEATRERLKQLLQEHDVSLNKLAKHSGIPSTTIKNLVYGHSNNIGINNIKAMCDGFKITLGEFFDTPLFDGIYSGWVSVGSKEDSVNTD